MPNLAGKTALVTGASRGMGRASALAVAAAGAQVLVHYGRGANEADGVVAEIRKAGGRADAIAADLAAPDGPHKLAKLVRDVVGDRLDILVANAGVSKAATIEETTVEDFDKLFAVNVRAPYFLVQQLLPVLREGSSLILVSSLGAHAAVGTLSAYAATKGAIDTLVKYFAAALGPRGIRVNAVAPGGSTPTCRTSSRPTRASPSFSACRRSSGSASPMMSARLWRSSPRKTRVGSPAIPSAWMAARSSECSRERHVLSTGDDPMTANDLKLYHSVTSPNSRHHSVTSPNSRRVRIFLAEKGLTVPLVPVDLAKGEQHSDAYRAINPRRVVPTLVLEDGTAIGEVLAIWRYLEEVYPTPPLLGSTPKDKALVTMWERRAELEGFAAVMEGVRNASEQLQSRAIAGPHDYGQIPALAERSKLRVKNFYADLDALLTEVPFVAGTTFSAPDITALVTVDFAAKAMSFSAPGEHAALARWHENVSSRPSVGA